MAGAGVNGETVDLGPGARFYAPFILIAAFLLAWAIDRTWPLPIEAAAQSIVRPAVGWTLLVTGLLLMFAGFFTLIRAKTTFWPDRAATRLVTAGPFSFSRNPIYVGDLGIYVGAALVLNMAWPILLLPIVLIAMRFYLVAREERHLAQAFGETYENYRRRVRRWL